MNIKKIFNFRYVLWQICHGFMFDCSWKMVGLPRVYRSRGSAIVVGRRFHTVNKLCRQSPIGVQQPVLLRTVRPGARIEIGDDVGISGSTIAAGKLVKIGNRVLIGAGALIMDNDFHSTDPELRKLDDRGPALPVIIEDDVFIGARAIVLKGVTIGRGAVIGAGVVVSHDVLPGMKYVG